MILNVSSAVDASSPENILPGAHKSQMSLKIAGKGGQTGQAWKSGFVSQLTPQPSTVNAVSVTLTDALLRFSRW